MYQLCQAKHAVPDGLRELFDSPSVRIDKQQIVHGFKLVKVFRKNPHLYFQFDKIFHRRRGSLGGKTAIACSGSFTWERFRHAEGIDAKVYFIIFNIKESFCERIR